MVLTRRAPRRSPAVVNNPPIALWGDQGAARLQYKYFAVAAVPGAAPPGRGDRPQSIERTAELCFVLSVACLVEPPLRGVGAPLRGVGGGEAPLRGAARTFPSTQASARRLS
jgi:hypothetical protein